MLRNYFKIAFRALLKHKAYTGINLVGLALGLCAGMFILLYSLDELSFDQFHEHKNRIYRVNTDFIDTKTGSSSINNANGWPVAKIMEEQFPETESVLYIRTARFLSINFQQKKIKENMHFATPSFFSMFSFPLLEGDAKTALHAPYQIVLSEQLAQKYFPNESALNKTLTLADTLVFTVSGVMKNIPAQSQIQSDAIISFSTYEKLDRSFKYTEGWGNINMTNYVLLKDHVDFNVYQNKVKNIYMDNVADMLKTWGAEAYISLEPLPDVYLKSEAGNALGPIGSIDRIYLLAGIAIFVLILGCINFINLATARSVYRAKEVGLRKVVGSSRSGLLVQFICEAFVIAALAALLAVVLLGLLLPFLNILLNKSYAIQELVQPTLLIYGFTLILAVSVLAGFYPAVVISGMQPAHVLKGKMQTSAKGTKLRQSLVVFQFIIASVLVTGTFIVLDQLRFMQNQNLGFDKERIVVVNAAQVSDASVQSFITFKEEAKKLSFVKEVSLTNAVPAMPGWVGQIAYPEGKAGEQSTSVEYISADEDYINTLALQVIAGETFDVSKPFQLEHGLIINEKAVKEFGWKNAQDAIGKKIDSPSGMPRGEVIGVVKDYHQEGLQNTIRAITIDYQPDYSFLFALKINTPENVNVLAALTQLWNKHFEGNEMSYFFLDERFANQYEQEQRLASILSVFSVITLVIAGIGLLGLVSFLVVARTKEIGIRKVLGAEAGSLVYLLNKEFIVLVLLANALSIPLVWWAAEEWLHSFAYRMQISPMVFAITIVVALVSTLLLVSFQTIRAAFANPVDSLRSE
ncbi:MAG: ABC transporter permease [Cyclobacteriaceae bacterium]|jgi:putative ABC transport system permease protein|nr:ABC transporter permease [Cytophagales bacterium]MCZ8327305.1 ABC transporter permease [Cyclobacteriaceae bacterium]